MTTRYDAILIGAGQAGPTLASRLAAAGKRVGLIERKQVGGTCVNAGCIPTKTLVASARVAHMARRASEFGIDVPGPIAVDMGRVQARMRGIVDQSVKSLRSWLEGMENVELIQGHARFESPTCIEVGGEPFEAEQVFLNVGARAFVPDLPGIESVDYLTNTGVLQLDSVPEHLLILGGGPIGLEFAQMFRRFGSEVTVVEGGPRLFARDDEDISTALHQILEAEGVLIHCNAKARSVAPHREGVALRIHAGDAEHELVGSHLLLAVGRTPNTDDLGLDAAGISSDPRGYIQVDEQLRTGVPGIWALGECNGRGAFTHTAYNDNEIVAANVIDGDSRRVTDRIPCFGLFVDPPLGRIGITEAEARASKRKVLIGRWPMSNVGRAKERSETQGFIKILVDAETEQVLGASVLGIGGDEVVHSLLALMYAKAPFTVMSRAVHIHPTVSELLPTTLQSLAPLE